VDAEWFLKYLDVTAEMAKKKAAGEPPSEKPDTAGP
jgi:hypothetical protein